MFLPESILNLLDLALNPAHLQVSDPEHVKACEFHHCLLLMIHYEIYY